jgi:hypothetical protein
MHITKRLFALCLSGGIVGATQAQQNTVAAGGDATSPSGSVSFSVGQVDYIQVATPSGSVSQGVQQPYQIDITTGIEEEGIQLSLSAFPNPTREELWLSVAGETTEGLSYMVTDERGRQLMDRQITADLTQIPLQDLAMAVYFLQVKRADQIVKTFRIVKL